MADPLLHRMISSQSVYHSDPRYQLFGDGYGCSSLRLYLSLYVRSIDDTHGVSRYIAIYSVTLRNAPSAGALGPAAQRGTIAAIYCGIGYPEGIYLKGGGHKWGRDIRTPESGGLEMGSLARA